MVRYDEIEQDEARRGILHSLEIGITFLTTGRSGFFSLFLFGLCYFLIFPSLVWCFNNPILLLNMILASFTGLALFSVCVRLVNKVRRKDTRALLYLIVFSATWLIILVSYGIGFTEAKSPIAMAFVLVGLSASYYYFVRNDRDESDDSDEILFFYLCGLCVVGFPGFIVALS